MKEYTEEQMNAWGNYTMLVGTVAITLVHIITLVFGVPPLDLLWQAALLLILVMVTYIYRQQYRKTKEKEE